ncbi:hypothetical protein KD050_20860 [Psychrobacillus sp. INOP01]|uniref:hypothetical protein n=1 Tax=Psychrobacillus sp. INOP01 TaxID=2829187 RepID=UPI001BA46027|nr:hypothetical protein [Psychrobacillus sp. INOP01]QUG41678.1 hypothetical protein KD050_20860 [Psychrobacillus sp. INOP01]
MQVIKKKRKSVSPPVVIAGSFLLLIIFGTLCLKLPFATTTPMVMFVGRIGPLTLFFLLMKPKKVHHRYPYDQVFTG